MSEAQQDYIDYLERIKRTQDKTLDVLNTHKINRLVGEGYGLTDEEMDQAVSITNILQMAKVYERIM